MLPVELTKEDLQEPKEKMGGARLLRSHCRTRGPHCPRTMPPCRVQGKAGFARDLCTRLALPGLSNTPRLREEVLLEDHKFKK
jgi:hypothetical protein